MTGGIDMYGLIASDCRLVLEKGEGMENIRVVSCRVRICSVGCEISDTIYRTAVYRYGNRTEWTELLGTSMEVFRTYRPAHYRYGLLTELTEPVGYGTEVVQKPLPVPGYIYKGIPVPRGSVTSSQI